MNSGRLPRFQRDNKIPSVTLTERDKEIIYRAFEHRFLRSTHLLALTRGSPQQILRRLQLLFHHGYLDRPRAQIDYYRRGSQAMVYGLGNKGMVLLERKHGIPRRKLDWTARNRSISRFFMEHTLAVADVMVTVELTCRAQGIGLSNHHTQGDSFRWQVPLRKGAVITSVGVVPDRVFGLKTQAGTHWFFLEADRATMPVERSNLKQTSFCRKLVAYHETWRQGLIKDRFPRFRVLTVTSTPQRVKNLVEASKRLTQGKGSGLFLFTNQRDFVSAENLLQLPLINGHGEQSHLLD